MPLSGRQSLVMSQHNRRQPITIGTRFSGYDPEQNDLKFIHIEVLQLNSYIFFVKKQSRLIV